MKISVRFKYQYWLQILSDGCGFFINMGGYESFFDKWIKEIREATDGELVQGTEISNRDEYMTVILSRACFL